ncbi:class II histocompatibility antigen, B-L beta chain-like isoform X2 [Manacus candei]|uniref:class II histocompatibility antigen, B-L beta chain-like isoform X2 n=1 Tax=Manacus candei TaxID=415023 RepID=UPI002225FF05|nr:class II histocompatibility antigen, B-L beta chain-like isoform X2 [Manacus candei]
MERVRGAGAVLAVLVVLGAPPAAGEELSGVFQLMTKSECHFINGTEWVRLVKRYIYNREQYAQLKIDLGTYVEDTLFGEKVAREWNYLPEWRELRWSEMERFCRHNYELSTKLLVNRRVPPSVSISLVPSSSQPGPGRLLCSGMDFYPAPVQVRWFQDGQELPEDVFSTDVVPTGDWTYQVLVLLEIPPRRGVTYSCQRCHRTPSAARSWWGSGASSWAWSSWRWGSASTCGRRAPEPPAAAAPPRGLGPSRDPPNPALIWGGRLSPPSLHFFPH